MRPRHPQVAALAVLAGVIGAALVFQPLDWSGAGAGAGPEARANRTARPVAMPGDVIEQGTALGLAASAAVVPPVGAAPVADVAPAAKGPAPGAPALGDDLAGTVLGPRSSGRPEDRKAIAVPPARLTIPVLGVFAAPVVEVGLHDSGELEVPPVSEVGWYRFGPHPGEPGSAVLAGHIAHGGVDGWFSRLGGVGAGDEVTVEHVDGGVSRWQVSSVEQFDKDELPLERVFSAGGEATLTLITCGGAFNPSLHSYEDNVVVFARRVA